MPPIRTASETFTWAQETRVNDPSTTGTNHITRHQKGTATGTLPVPVLLFNKGMLLGNWQMRSSGKLFGNIILDGNDRLLANSTPRFSCGMLLGNGTLLG